MQSGPGGCISDLDEMEDTGAAARTCRICFEPEAEDEGMAAANPLISPCACKGSSEFVHRKCLFACQRACATIERRDTCSVCLQRYSELLDIPAPPELKPGDLLLASPDLSGTFQSSVVLLCEFGRRILGVVLSHECVRPPAFPALPKTRFFAGGPVCGGRFGVVQYVIGVVVSAADAISQDFPRIVLGPAPAGVGTLVGQSGTGSGEGQGEGRGGERGATEGTDEQLEAGTAEEPRLDGYLCMRSEWRLDDEKSVPGIAQRYAEDARVLAVLVFKGYCAWGTQQLKNEFDRGMWGFTAGNIDDLRVGAPPPASLPSSTPLASSALGEVPSESGGDSDVAQPPASSGSLGVPATSAAVFPVSARNAPMQALDQGPMPMGARAAVAAEAVSEVRRAPAVGVLMPALAAIDVLENRPDSVEGGSDVMRTGLRQRLFERIRNAVLNRHGVAWGQTEAGAGGAGDARSPPHRGAGAGEQQAVDTGTARGQMWGRLRDQAERVTWPSSLASQAFGAVHEPRS